MAAKKKAEEVPVDNYPERPYDDAKAPDGYYEKVEARQPDQIADYHEKNPTLKAESPAHKADVPTGEPGDAVE